MSFADDILLGRKKARKDEVMRNYAEASRLDRARYDAEQEEKALRLERDLLEFEELRSRRQKADAAMSDRKCEDDGKMAPQSCLPDRSDDFARVTWWRLLGRPWSCIWRVFLIAGIISSVILGIASKGEAMIAHLYAAVMSACIPFTICIFFAELARRVCVKFWMVVAVFVVGGVLSILLTLFVGECLPFLCRNAIWAGVVEEPCKGAVLLVLLFAGPKIKGTLAGLAFGSAVGAGFAAIETYGYAYRFGMNGLPSTWVLMMRGVLSPLMHTGWTAALGGAVWYACRPCRKAGSTTEEYIYAAVVMCGMIMCHCVWNSESSIGCTPLVVWFLIFHYAIRGVQEVDANSGECT